MEKDIKRSLFASFGFKLFLIVGITIVTSGALTYGFLVVNKRQSDLSSLTTTCFDVTFKEGKSIALENAASISDASGQRLDPYTFFVTNNCEVETSYTVILSTKMGSINPKFISTSINGETAVVLADSLENRSYDVDEEYNSSYILKTGSIKMGETASFDLRVWINSTATYDDVKGLGWEGEVKVFNGIKEVEDMRLLTNKLKTIAKTSNPDFTTISQDSGVYVMADDDGDSYYFRGNVENNHLYFAGLYWRIVRLNGDGSLRIAYDGTSIHANKDASEDRIAVSNVYPVIEGGDNNLESSIDEWYQTNIALKDYDKYVAEVPFCEESKTNASTPTFTCNFVKHKKAGLLSLDELVTSGAALNNENDNFYLYRGASFWLGTNAGSENSYILNDKGSIEEALKSSPSGVVPVINISKEYVNNITGNGTLENPYVL